MISGGPFAPPPPSRTCYYPDPSGARVKSSAIKESKALSQYSGRCLLPLERARRRQKARAHRSYKADRRRPPPPPPRQRAARSAGAESTARRLGTSRSETRQVPGRNSQPPLDDAAVSRLSPADVFVSSSADQSGQTASASNDTDTDTTGTSTTLMSSSLRQRATKLLSRTSRTFGVGVSKLDENLI